MFLRAARRRAWQALRLAEIHYQFGKVRCFSDMKRHEIVDTFLPVPIQNRTASGAARKSCALFNRFLSRMSTHLRRVRHQGLTINKYSVLLGGLSQHA